MIRLAIDTNVYISALMFGGLPGALLDLVFLQSFVTVISPDLLDELDEKLRLKFDVSPEDAATVLDRIAGTAQLVHPEETLHVIREDPDDDRVLECAVSGKANYIVTGDRHLLKLGEYRGIRIMRVREFLDSIEQEPNE
jgi:uncharacterized protein